jgi:hypothetical protein
MVTKNLLGLERLETRDTPRVGFSSLTLPTLQFVSGTVFADANGNGVRDAGENGVNGVRVYLDTNGNGVRDLGEPSAVTSSRLSVSFEGGQVVTRQEAGAYTFNGAVGGKASTGAVRVELPAGATLTTPVQTIPAATAVPPVNVGLSGVSGTPDSTSIAPPAPVVVAPPSGGTTTTGSSASVSAIASVGPDGKAFASVSGSVSGNGTVFGSASATGTNGTITSIFVG